MEDAFERRALLSYLGHVLQVLARISEKQSIFMTIGDLIERNPILADEPLLGYLDRTLLVEEFITRVLRAFCLWPQWLLEDLLDRKAFPAAVHDHLFRDNRVGWKSYAAILRSEVDWFDVPKDHRSMVADSKFDPAIVYATNEQQEGAPSDEGDMADSRVMATDIERGYGAEASADNVEALTPLNNLGYSNEQVPANHSIRGEL